MKILLLLLIEGIIFNCVNSASEKDSYGSVVFVNMLWRHGERTPVTFYDSDPYRDESYWEEGLGELTNEGKKQQYELGRWLRERYDDLLTDEFSVDRVYVQSTDVDRTIMSAQCNLAGMYPPKGRQVWDKRLPWQPIPVHTTPEELDKVIAVGVPCPAYDQEFERVMQSEEVQQLYQRYHDVINVVRYKSGGEVLDFKYLHDIWDTFTIEKRRGYRLPKWAVDILPRMHEIAEYRFLVETWTKKLRRIKAGLLLQEMIENMKNRTENKNNRVVNMYSGHDLTVSRLLSLLGVYDGEIPPYASCVMLELREDSDGKHHVMLFYRNSTSAEPFLLKVPGCSSACPLEKFVSLAQPLIPEDFDKECQES